MPAPDEIRDPTAQARGMLTTDPLGPRRPTAREILREIQPLVEVIPVAGPPAAALLGPWLLLALMLTGPFALLVTLAVLVAFGALLVAAAAALLASPYLLVRRLRAHREPEAQARAVTAGLVGAPPGSVRA